MVVEAMSEARTHAVTASELLDSLERLTTQLREASPDRMLQLQATGSIVQINRTIEYTMQLSAAHSLAALALIHTESD